MNLSSFFILLVNAKKIAKNGDTPAGIASAEDPAAKRGDGSDARGKGVFLAIFDF